MIGNHYTKREHIKIRYVLFDYDFHCLIFLSYLMGLIHVNGDKLRRVLFTTSVELLLINKECIHTYTHIYIYIYIFIYTYMLTCIHYITIPFHYITLHHITSHTSHTSHHTHHITSHQHHVISHHITLHFIEYTYTSHHIHIYIHTYRYAIEIIAYTYGHKYTYIHWDNYSDAASVFIVWCETRLPGTSYHRWLYSQ